MKQKIQRAKQHVVTSSITELNQKIALKLIKTLLQELLDIEHIQLSKINLNNKQELKIQQFSSYRTDTEGIIKEESNMKIRNFLNNLKNDRVYLGNDDINDEVYQILNVQPDNEQYYFIKHEFSKDFIMVFSFHSDSPEKMDILNLAVQNQATYQDFWDSVINSLISFVDNNEFTKRQFINNQLQIIKHYLEISDELIIELFRQNFEEVFSIQCNSYFGAYNQQQDIDDNMLIQTIFIPDTHISLKYAINYLDIFEKSSLFAQFEKMLIFIYYKWEQYQKQVIEIFNNYNQLQTENTVHLFFNQSDQLVFISEQPSYEFIQKYKLSFNIQELSYEQIFQDSEEILQFINKYKDDQNKSNIMKNPQIQMCVATSKDNKYKGFQLILKDDFDNQDIFALQSIQSGFNQNNNNAVTALHKLNYINRNQSVLRNRRGSNYKQILINNLDIQNSWVVEFLPTTEQNKLSQVKKKPEFFYKEAKKSIKMNTPFRSSQSQQQNSNLNQRKSKIDIDKSKNLLMVLGSKRQNSNIIKLNVEELIKIPEIDAKIDNFDFDVFQFSEKEKLRIVWSVFQKRNFFQDFQIPLYEFNNFTSRIRHLYNKNKNPFHNFDHGVTVMHGCYMIGCNTRAQKILDPLQQLALIFSGLCHDVKHTARTNVFEQNSMSKLAVRFHDKSVLESHHIATTFKVLQKEENNIFKNFDLQQFKDLRKYVIKNILSTDIAKHFKKLKQFEKFNDSYDETKDIDTDQKLLITGIIIHTADFHGSAQKYDLSSKWSYNVNKEFQEQYAQEGRLNINQTPYLANLDQKHVLAKGEMGFIKVIVKPLWIQLNNFLKNDLDYSVQCLEQNENKWEEVYNKEFKEYEENKKEEENQNQNSPYSNSNSVNSSNSQSSGKKQVQESSFKRKGGRRHSTLVMEDDEINQ